MARIVLLPLRNGQGGEGLSEIVDTLRSLHLDPDRVLLRAFNGARMDQMVKDGTDLGDSPSTNAYTIDEIASGKAAEMFNILADYNLPAVAVYDRSQLMSRGGSEYLFAKPESKPQAVLAILKLEY